MALRSLGDRTNVRFERGTYDLRKFEVRTSTDDQKVGVVDDVIVDDRGRGRYLCVDLDADGRHVLVPVGHAASDPGRHTVWVTGLGKDAFRKLPGYRHDPSEIDGKYERSLAEAYDDATADAPYSRADYQPRGWGRGKHGNGHHIERVDRMDDVRVAKNDPDPRGWEVIGRDGTKIGKVEHLLGDRDSMKVAYLVMKLDSKIVKDTRHALIPAGHAAVDSKRKRVRVSALDKTRAAKLPKHVDGELDRDREREIVRFYSEGYPPERHHEHPRYADDGLYAEERIERSEEELRVGKTQRKSGEVVAKKRVETEHVRKPVSVRHEEVDVERRPVTGKGREAHIGDDEIRIPLTEEEVVVEKRPVVKEEIVVRKRVVDEEEMVEEDVRRERVDVERHDGERRSRP